MISKIRFAFEIAQFIIFVVRAARDLVVEAEEMLPEKNQGSKKFAIVKDTLIKAADTAGFAGEIITVSSSVIDEKIEDAVKEKINKE